MGYYAMFWSSSEATEYIIDDDVGDIAYIMELYYSSDRVSLYI
ncbi:MAG: hypothetical protein PUB71_01715 [Hallerella succinigenes]|nr:hypothetical protein [Hallerella succinigenes]MDD6091211.1 hypothetical protein [Hallerella succinigenes]MDY5029718.1 hypothetical protein [Hallerella succinigenes]